MFHSVYDITKALLKYSKYNIDKLQLKAQTIQMQIAVIFLMIICVNEMIGGVSI